MYAFLIGLAAAVVLTVGAVLTYNGADITMVEHSSPSASVRVDSDASKTALGSGYGSTESNSHQPMEDEETARR